MKMQHFPSSSCSRMKGINASTAGSHNLLPGPERLIGLSEASERSRKWRRQMQVNPIRSFTKAVNLVWALRALKVLWDKVIKKKSQDSSFLKSVAFNYKEPYFTYLIFLACCTFHLREFVGGRRKFQLCAMWLDNRPCPLCRGFCHQGLPWWVGRWEAAPPQRRLCLCSLHSPGK